MNAYIIFSIVAAVIAIAYGLFISKLILRKPAGNARMQEIASAIQQGAKAYLNRQYKTIGYIAVVLFVILWISLGFVTALGFAVGAIFSALAGYMAVISLVVFTMVVFLKMVQYRKLI